MTSKEEVFISEYLKTFNATQSAIVAGYSKKTASVIGYENLRKPYIKEAIKAGMEEIVGPNERIIKENIELWRAIMIDPEAKFTEKLKASELIGKYAMMFTDKVELSGNIDNNITFFAPNKIIDDKAWENLASDIIKK